MRKSGKAVSHRKNITVEKVISDFIAYKKASKSAERTIVDYKKHLKLFFNQYSDEALNLEKLETVVLQDFARYSDKAAATYNLHYAYMHSFFNWLIERKYLQENPITTLKLKKRKAESKAKNVPESVIEKLLDAMDLDTYVGLRDYALTVLTMDTGIRPSEALATREVDYDLDNGVLVIREEIAKTRVGREVMLSQQTCEIIKILNSYKPKGFCQNMFCSWEGEPINTHAWYLRLREYSREINYKVRPYDLRHSFAIQFIKGGGSAFALRKILGHTNMNMTQVYVNLAESDMKEQLEKASPVHRYVKRATKIKRKN